MDVIIGGAGVGGLALAGGLIADGHQVQVLERSRVRHTGGAALTIYANGAAALERLGIRLSDLGARIDQLAFCRSDGRSLMAFDLRSMEQRFGYPVRTVPRRELIGRLEERLPAGVLCYGCAIDSVEVGETVTIVSSGGRLNAQVVIGADGAHSSVRRSVLDATPASLSGWATWQGLTSVLPELAEGATGHFLVGDAGFVGMMPAGSGLLQWWFDVPWSSRQPLPSSPLAWLRDRFSAYLGATPALLRAISDADVDFFPHLLHRVPEQWGTGAVTLLGDAAHAFPPSQAQGANQAFEDAAVLTRALALEGDPVELLRRYERCRLPRVRLVSRMAASERTNRPPGALLGAVARLTPGALASRSYARLLQKFSSVLSGDEP